MPTNNQKNSPSLDDLRIEFPHLGFAVYAYKPGDAVTLEVHAADGQIFPFVGPSLSSCVARAFPDFHVEPESIEVPEINVFD